MTKNKRIQDLYFGVMLPEHNTRSEPWLKPGNLFDCGWIRYWAAKWVLENPQSASPITNPLSYIFGDVWARAEYEWSVGPLYSNEGATQKLDLYEAYVKPNEELLLSMIKECSKNSARQYIREHGRRFTR